MVRFKNRYFLVQIKTKENVIVDGLSSYSIKEEILGIIQEMYGTFGVAVTNSLMVKYYSPYTQVLILRIQREYSKLLQTCLFFKRKLRNTEASFLVKRISGTIKKLQLGLVEYDLKILQGLQLKPKRFEQLKLENEQNINKMTT
jgi:ribonuclease P/MRP protein subunit POP5